MLLIEDEFVNPQQYNPQYGFHPDYGLVMHFPGFDSFIQYFNDKGYSAIIYMITVTYPESTNGYADYRFTSPTLQELNWIFV